MRKGASPLRSDGGMTFFNGAKIRNNPALRPPGAGKNQPFISPAREILLPLL
jgi:hypothetical protein